MGAIFFCADIAGAPGGESEHLACQLGTDVVGGTRKKAKLGRRGNSTYIQGPAIYVTITER